MFNEHIDQNYQPPPEDRPGGFDWGEGNRMNAQDAPPQQPQPPPEANQRPHID